MVTMLRPATPLTVLLFVAFVLDVLSVISTPIVKSIPLGSFEGTDFGVFGFCVHSRCSGAEVGYSTVPKDSLGDSDADKDFRLSPNTRSSLSSILIVHPIAAFFTLVCLMLAASAHLHSPSHSPRYLLALLILLLPTLLITLLAFLVDILLFVPHLAWGGWIVLVSTILITASGILTCAMRRTLVSRKARKRRIAANAEMSGENYYNNQSMARAESPPPLTTDLTAPMVNGAPGSDKLPAFATFDAGTSGTTDDEYVPLNTNTSSNRTLPSNGTRNDVSDDSYDRYASSRRGAPGGMRGERGARFNGPRDEFGNPLPPSNAFGPVPQGGLRREPLESRMTHQYSSETTNSQGPRGRGTGYPLRGYGRGSGPNGNERGIPMGAMAAGTGSDTMAGDNGNGRQGPPPGYANEYQAPRRGMPVQYSNDIYAAPVGAQTYGRDPSAPGYSRRPSPGLPPPSGGYGRQPSPGPPSAPRGYSRQPSPGPPSIPGGYNRRPSPGPPSVPGVYGYVSRESTPGPGQNPYRAESPPPPIPELRSGETPVIGQAVEMDAYTGSPSPTPTFHRPMQLTNSNPNGQGPMDSERQQQTQRKSSVYSVEQPYISPRAAWAGGPARNGTPPHNPSKTLSPIEASPIELPTHQSPNPQSLNHAPSHGRKKSSETYYEDVDPRFAEPFPSQTSAPLPISLVPGSNVNGSSSQPPNSHPPPTSSPVNSHPLPPHLQPSNSYEDIHSEETRSPTTSDASNFTSISQRDVNPDWRPPLPPPAAAMGAMMPNRRPQQQSDILLQANPDFELPGGNGGGGGGGGAGRGRGGRGPGIGAGGGGGGGGGNVGRYPGADI